MRQTTEMILSRAPNVQSRSVQGCAVLVNLASGACFELNKVGAEVWELLSTGATESSICRALEQKYPAAEVTITADVKKLLLDLITNKLISTDIHTG